jgi:hypothetical protein
MAHATEAPAGTMAEGQTSHTQNQAVGLALLRADFPSEQINNLPRLKCPACRNSRTGVCENPRHAKAECKECGNYISVHHLHLPYVGHAELTNRLLEADPLWTWEPVAFDQRGLPAFDGDGGLWIRLTVCGHTRLGYGDAQGKKGPNAVKEAIGDALRNAAMRFGAALDLWAKSDLREAQTEHPKSADEDVRTAGSASERQPQQTQRRESEPGPQRPPQQQPAPAGAEDKMAVLDRLYLQAVDGRNNPLILTQVRGAAAKDGVLEFEVDGPPPQRKRMPFRELLDLLEAAAQQQAAQGVDTERSAV